MICYATSLDMEPNRMEDFARRSLLAASKRGYGWLEEAGGGIFPRILADNGY